MRRHLDNAFSGPASNFAGLLSSAVGFGWWAKLGLPRPVLTDAGGGVSSSSTRSEAVFESLRADSRFGPPPVSGLSSSCSEELKRAMVSCIAAGPHERDDR